MDERQAGHQLRGQEPENPSPSEIADWTTMYERLIAFTEPMLERTRAFLVELHGPPREHVVHTNVRIMEEELATFRERLAVWRARAEAPAPRSDS